ncbi:hypothetical protein GQ607_006858 [Colletotrichum asianum]|uniref:Uncharacterized protein n=1 Tax=Colletotrichum asianum TaxID=702518 RepID=A0A8H3WGR9_9PEZI|nr:hypothetical protein GQ607_006858 [Colletotrichum asianum]
MRLPRAAATAAPQSLPRIQRPLAIPKTRNPARATTTTDTAPHSPRPSPTTPPAPLLARPPWRPLRCCRPALLLSKQPLNRSSSSTCSETQRQQPLNSSSNHTAPPANLPDVIPRPRQSVRNLNSTTLAILRKHASISTTSTAAAYCYHNHHPGAAAAAPRQAVSSSLPIHTLTSGAAASIQTELLHRRSQTSGTTRATPPGNISHHQPRPTAYLTRYLLHLCLFPVSPL